MIATALIQPIMFVKMVTFSLSLCILFFSNLECVVTPGVMENEIIRLFLLSNADVSRSLWSLNASRKKILPSLFFFHREKAVSLLIVFVAYKTFVES